MQSYAESALKRHAPRGGAMVILDVRNGAVLAMASNPMFDLNDFIPGIPDAEYAALTTDVLTPLHGRAFQGGYPPASTFKVVTALAALESGAITTGTTYDCDAVYNVGNRPFHNWNKEPEGPMSVVTAIKRSCNTWFYQAGLDTGSGPIVAMAQRMGFGERTGLPISEEPGFMPTDSITQAKLGHKILGGDLANICIGQGMVLASPLQVAQCMAGVADGTDIPQVRLVQQVQDVHDHIVEAWPPSVHRRIALQPSARAAVVRGMVAVVSGEGGTGHNAAIKYAQIAGKTGTGQWKIYDDPDRDRKLAWFAGFLPANNPVFSFSVLYEGSPGEKVSGGAVAAPIVEEVFNKIYKNAPPDDPLIAAGKGPRIDKKADDDLVEEDKSEDSPRKARPVQEATPPPPPPAEQKKTLGGFLKKLFGRP
jgi:penicillin-binding protein 2